jgi:hypothetical protein
MDSINLMKNDSRFNGAHSTPLRGSNSPPANRPNRDLDELNDSFAGGRNRATAPMTETAGPRRVDRSPLRNSYQNYNNQSYEYVPEYVPSSAMKRTAAPPGMDLLAKIDTLQQERDHFAAEASAERAKNLELEKEFMVLRSLIAE